jgi:hypothetical protein
MTSQACTPSPPRPGQSQKYSGGYWLGSPAIIGSALAQVVV